jgi:hypothetical protein
MSVTEKRMPEQRKSPPVSQDAAIVLALAGTAVPFASSPESEAERWLRILRLHGQVGCAMQALGIGEAPLESPAEPRSVRLLRARPIGEDIVELVADRAKRLAVERDSELVCTVDVFFALSEIYGWVFDRALYLRGATRQELVDKLAVQQVEAD